MNSFRVMVLSVMSVGAMALNAADPTVDDIIKLTERNLGEEVMLAAVQASGKPYALSADDILKLKEKKVSERVIAAMIRHRPGADVAVPAAPAPVAPVAPAPAPVVAAPAPAPRVEAPVVGQPVFGVLNIENLDEKTWSYRFEPDTQTIWISTSAPDGRGNVQAHGGVSIRMPAGAYNIRYNGQDRGQKVSVFEGDKSLLMISRVETAEVEALYVSVFERGERKASGRLVTLRENPAPREDNVIRKSSTLDQPVRERIVERVVEVPQTIVYREPSYVYTTPSVIFAGGYYGGGYYGGSRYYGSRYYDNCYYPSYRSYGRSYYGGSYYSGRGYGYRGGRSGVSVGVGFRF